MSNGVRTALYLGVLTALVVAIAWLLGAPLWGALGAAAAANFAAYWFSDKLALRGARARPVTEQQMPDVYRIVRELTEQEGMPMPSIHRIKTNQANAFATGRNPRHAAVAVTDGIMDLLDEQELRGVLGHELSHVKNRDILISSIAAVLGATLSFAISRAAWSGKNNSGWMLPAIILTPIASVVLRSGISKTREFEADHDGGEITEDPLALASALERIEDSTRRFPMKLNAALGALFISDPLLGFGGSGMLNLLSTHPPTVERVARLNAQAEEHGWDDQPPHADEDPAAGAGRSERQPGQQRTARRDHDEDGTEGGRSARGSRRSSG